MFKYGYDHLMLRLLCEMGPCFLIKIKEYIVWCAHIQGEYKKIANELWPIHLSVWLIQCLNSQKPQ